MLPQGGVYDPALAIAGFQIPDSSTFVSSPLLGFTLDGRKIYGPYDSTGSLAWGLDSCNGRWEANGRADGTAISGLELAEQSTDHLVVTYTYRATPDFPYLVGCFGPAGASTSATRTEDSEGDA